MATCGSWSSPGASAAPGSSSACAPMPRQVGAEVTAVVNVGDDVRMHGLQICPDLDSVMYTLGGARRPRARLGPGRRDLGDQGRAGAVRRRAVLVRPGRQGHRHPSGTHHDARTRATRCPRSPPPSASAGSRASRCCRPPTTGWRPTWWSTSTASARRCTSRSGGCATAATCRPTGSSSSAPSRAKPAAGVLEAIGAADVVLVAPSNPVVSIAPILAVPRLRTPWWAARRRSSGSRRSSAARRCAAWPTAAWPRSASR